MHIRLLFIQFSDNKEIQRVVDVEDRWRDTVWHDLNGKKWKFLKLIGGKYTSMIAIFDCRCHLVRHQHRNDNVVKITLSATTLCHWVQNVVIVNVPLIIVRWIEYWTKPLLTTYYIHTSWNSRKTWYIAITVVTDKYNTRIIYN